MPLNYHIYKYHHTTKYRFFVLGFQPIGYEYAAEITFPEPDNIVGGIMNISTHIFGVLFTLICSEINSYLGDLVGNLVS